jgi:conjugative transfer signal peptidase TraF
MSSVRATPRTLAAVVMVLGLAALCVPAATRWRDHWTPRMVYNASDSVPRGWYRIEPTPNSSAGAYSVLALGDLVLVRLPADVAALAAQRGYLPVSVPLLKRVAAAAPQCVCVREQVLRIDGVAMATLRSHDGAHRQLHAWRGCRRLVAQELLLLGDAGAASFDSRYFGPLDASAVIGIARPVQWPWRRP